MPDTPYTHKLSFWLISVGVLYYFALIPIQPIFLPASAGMMIAGIGWLLMLMFHFKNATVNRHSMVVLLLFILYYVFGLTTSDDPDYREIMRIQIPLLLWSLPFVVYYPEFRQTIVPLIVRVFVVSALVSAIIFIAYYLLIELRNTPVEYSKRSPYYFLPVHYLSMYYNVALALLLWGNVVRKNHLLIATISVLSIAILMLSARMQWLIYFLLISLYFITAFYTKKKTYRPYFLLLLIGLAVLLFQIPEVKRRMYETYDEFRSIKTKKNEKQTNHRIFIWREAIALLKSAPLSGYKPGIADRLLMERLSELDDEFWDGEKVYMLKDGHYNYHNQFLQGAAERGLGIIGLIGALLFVFFNASYGPAKYTVLVLSLSMLTESVLQRQAGVFLAASFIPLMVALNTTKKADSDH